MIAAIATKRTKNGGPSFHCLLPFAFCKQFYFHFPTAFDAVDTFRRATNSSKEISPSPSRSTSDTIALIAFPERKKGDLLRVPKKKTCSFWISVGKRQNQKNKHGFEFWDPERSKKIRCERFATNVPDVNDILASPSACSFKIAASSSFVIRPSPSLSKTLKADHSTSFFKYCFWPQGDITWMSKATTGRDHPIVRQKFKEKTTHRHLI